MRERLSVPMKAVWEIIVCEYHRKLKQRIHRKDAVYSQGGKENCAEKK